MPGNRIMSGFPLSRRNLRKSRGPGDPLYELLDFHALRDVSFEQFDFNIKALDTTNTWTVAAGSTATTWAVRAEPGGWIRGATGTTAATSGLQISIPQKYWSGDKKAGMAALVRASTTASLRLEIGFVNALPSVNTAVGATLATPTFNTATTVAMYIFDQTGTAAATQGLYVAGTSMTSAAYTFTSPAPSATTPFFVAVQTIGDNVFLWAGDSSRPVVRTTVATNFEGGDGIIPAISIINNSTTSHDVDVDFIATWSERVG